MAPRFAWRLRILFPALISCALLLPSPCGSLQALREVIALLADDKDPKCFTRVDRDLTCFWKDSSNTSYDFYYEYEGEEEEKKCTLTHQSVDPATVLHVCSFPPEDVYLFVQAHIKVTESGTNNTVHERVLNVENQDEIHLNCFTPDLQSVICNWNSEEMEKDTQYTLYYQSRNGDWEVCDHSDITNTCTFQGWNSSDIIVTVNASSRHQNHTFYKEPISMNHMVLTAPPKHLAGEVNDGKLSLQWEPAVAELAEHMVYQVRYSLDNHSGWKHITLESPEPRALLDVQAGSQYHIQIKTKPNGDTYRGSWSKWSHTFTVAVPLQLGLLLIGFVPLVLILTAVVIMATFSKFFSKIKQHLWPPVPDLDRVLENFLTEINKGWQPMQPFNEKLCEEDVLPTVVEIVSEEETSNSTKSQGDDVDSPSPALGRDRLSLSEEKPPLETASQGYVVLDPEHDVTGYEKEGKMDSYRPVSLHCQPCSFPDSSVHGSHVLPQPLSWYSHLASQSLHLHPPHSADISNHSYLLLADSESKIQVDLQLSGEANLYANVDGVTQLIQRVNH
ncbi:thrombopoietin receptor isoform X2 [Polyodon spathula]|uniref:thrombopoietin receptor isoform X2 n=1 Tax=Polyodon spathula TaxID=7913 RepID=UPI001B7F1630|nr:thrombopoietin receptor isoform X2 [Polyodon spathula]